MLWQKYHIKKKKLYRFIPIKSTFIFFSQEWGVIFSLFVFCCFNIKNSNSVIQDYLYSAFYDTVVAKQLYRKLSLYNSHLSVDSVIVFYNYTNINSKLVLNLNEFLSFAGLACYCEDVFFFFTKINAILYAYLKLFKVFPQVIKVWKTVNKFHPNVICLFI